MKQFYTFLLTAVLSIALVNAQQVPNAGFEDWSGTTFNNEIQPAGWNASNVEQSAIGMTFRFNFAHREAGHSGNYCMMVQDQDVGAAGITETSPGYFSLGQPWQYLEGLNVNGATAGTSGGVAWTYRPDSMSVWIKRTGDNTAIEDFYLLYYSWSGQARGDKYKNKNNSCTSVTKYNEESDIRQALDGNECGTAVKATQVAEGMWREKATYSSWTNIRVPIYYMTSTAPTTMNLIFSASNYPNFRAHDGLYAGNSLYVDDVSFIYSSAIDQLTIGNKVWAGFDPNSSEEQVYSLGENATEIPAIEARRGVGSLTNAAGTRATFAGRVLDDSEMTITTGVIDGTPTIITVAAEDGSSTHTYRIKFVRAASSNCNLVSIAVNGTNISNFNANNLTYNVPLPYGTTDAPTVEAVAADPDATIVVTQPTSVNGAASIKVTAASGATKTYTLNFSVAALSDNRLADIRINGNSLPGFSPDKFIYRKVSLPLNTTTMPTVEAVEMYPNQQTVVHTVPDVIDGGTYQLAVTTPGNSIPNVYKLTFKIEVSSYSYLSDLTMGDGTTNYIQGFVPTQMTYRVSLPMGTTSLPAITAVKGDEFQTVEVQEGGLDGTTLVTVTAANGDQSVYKIIVSTAKSEISSLDNLGYVMENETIWIDGFNPATTTYNVSLPIGTTETYMPVVYVKGDEYETVTVVSGSTTKVNVVAGNGNSTLYLVKFGVNMSTVNTLQKIFIDGAELSDFDPDVLEYNILLPKGTTAVPVVTYEQGDAYQTINKRDATSPNGDTKIIVRPQSGVSRTYTIHFSVEVDENNNLSSLLVGGVEHLQEINEDLKDTITLPVGTIAIPTIQAIAESAEANVQVTTRGKLVTITVTAANGAEKVYQLLFVTQVSDNAYLQAIYLDGVLLPDFAEQTLEYTISVADNSTPCPAITYEKGDPTQQVIVVAPATTGLAQLQVIPQGADAGNTYTISFQGPSDGGSAGGEGDEAPTYTFEEPTLVVPDYQIPDYAYVDTCVKSADVTLLNMEFLAYENGETTESFGFNPATTVYNKSVDAGANLPDLHVYKREGQTIVVTEPTADMQRIMVLAENGVDTCSYFVNYTRIQSNNALLKAILINGDTIANFAPTTYTYVDSLAWRTTVVPSVYPVAGTPAQTITTTYSKVNGTTTIHVVSPDGEVTSDYAITFPVVKSSNTALSDLYFDGDVDIAFRPNTLEYNILLPYGDTIVPPVLFTKAEHEQRVELTAKPLGDTTLVIVTAENGDSRTYRLFIRAEEPAGDNRLTMIRVVELDKELSLRDKTQRDFEVEMPYGSRTLTVEYQKNYEEQTVIVQNGGVNDTTKLFVLSNKESAENTVYNIIPIVPTADPAVVSDIKVNDVTIPGFNPEQFSYIVPVSTKPILRYEVADGVRVNVLAQTSKHWEAEVTVGDRTNRYNVWFYYTNEQVPNMDFTQWSQAAKYTSAQKPTGWNCPADAVDKHTGFGTFTPDGLVTKISMTYVDLKTLYSDPGGGNIPGFITLGKVKGNWGVAGSTSFGISGGIKFHNSPDVFSIRYALKSVHGNGNLVTYELTGMDGVSVLEWQETTTSSTQKTYTYPLTQANNEAGEPVMLNITICSYYQVDGTIASTPRGEMLVDWIRFSYNHVLSSLKVDDITATKNDTAFTATLTDPERIEKPSLTFTGQVADQAQLVTWTDTTTDEDYEIRTADIRNFAENGTDYTDYTLTVKRPLDTNTELDSLLVGGVNIYQADANDFNLTIGRTTPIPDVQPFPASSRQNVHTAIDGNVVTLTITPEKGDPRIITITFNRQISNKTTLKSLTVMQGENSLTTDVPFNETTYAYTVQTLNFPAVTFDKWTDGQVVNMVENNNTIILTVTAEDGTTGTPYTITIDDAQVTTGLLTGIQLDGEEMLDFNTTTSEYVVNQPTWTGVTKAFDRDNLVLVQTQDKEVWKLYDSSDAEHSYTLNYYQAADDDPSLKAIYIGDTLIEYWSPTTTEYELATDTAVNIISFKNNSNQTVHLTFEDSTYYFDVTAANQVETRRYTLQLMPDLSNIATLKNISVEGYDIAYREDSFYYELLLPAPAVKLQETPMPAITYEVGHPGQTVVVEQGAVGELTYLNVTAEDGSRNTYILNITAEPSHNANLDMIYVNGWRVDSLFESGRHYYAKRIAAETVNMQYLQQDKFQTVTITSTEVETGHFTERLHVLAQDGITTADYYVDVYLETMSNIATLDNILLNGAPMSEYNVLQNPELSFDPGNNNYIIYMPQGSTSVPEVGAVLTAPVKDVTITKDGTDVDILVTAKDEVHINTYHLSFREQQSPNAYLEGINYTFKNASGFWEERTIIDFNHETYFYTVTLPQEVRGIQKISWTNGDEFQTVNSRVEPIGNDAIKATIDVLAGDATNSKEYVVLFQFSYASETYLNEINANLVRLDGYDRDIHNYYITLDPGTANHPELGYEKARESQTVLIDTIQFADNKMVRQLRVTAESGDYAIYTVTSEIRKHTDNQLTMIYVGVDSLNGFTPEGTTFYHTLPYGTSMLPIVKYEAEETETVSTAYMVDTTAHSLGQMVQLTVTAENGTTHDYTIHFPIEYNNDATLSMITMNETQIMPGFNENLLNYKVTLGMAETLPKVEGILKDANTQSISYQTLGDALDYNTPDTVIITVIAEDQVTSKDYRIIFTHAQSTNHNLQDILVSGVEQPMDFDPLITRYDFTIPFGQDTLPQVVPVLAEQGQWVEELWSDTIWADEKTAQFALEIDVYAPSCAQDPAFCEDVNVYQLVFTLGKNNDNTLAAILVKNDTLPSFDPNQTEYNIDLAVGTQESDKLTLEDFTAIPNDDNASVSMTLQDNGTVIIAVTAANGEVRTYVITQEITLSSENRLSALTADGELLNNFNPDLDYTNAEYEYIYYLPAGGSVPEIEALPLSTQVSVSTPLINAVLSDNGTMLGYEAIIICTAENNADREYRIFMPYDTINNAQSAKATDCLVKVIPGGKLLVGTIRMNVRFYVYNVNGGGTAIYELTPCDANHREVVVLANGDEQLIDFWGNNGTEVQLQPGTTYVYSFYENDNKILLSGKIITLP